MKQLLIISITVLLIAPLQSQNQHLTPENLWKIGRLGLDDISPDGKTALYGVTYYDIEKNSGNRDLYIIPTKGGIPKKITAFDQHEYNGQYRPDGKKIGFLKGGNLWEMNPDGTDQHKISDIQMNGFKYAPDNKNILYIQDVKYRKKANEIYPDLPLTSAKIIDDLMYRHWDQWDDFANSNIFVAPYNDGKIGENPTNIINQPYDSPLNPFGGMEEIAWSPDGKKIAYTCKKLSGKEYAISTNSDIYIYDLDTKTTTNLTQGMPGYDKEPAFSPDGNYIAWNSMEEPGFESDRNRIFIYNFKTKKKTEITKGLDRACNSPHWSKDQKNIYFITGEKATNQIAAINIQNHKFRFITKGIHNYYDIIPASNNLLIGRKCSMSMPHELFEINAKTGTESQLTFTNSSLLQQIKMGKIEKKLVKTTDGKDMLVWMIYPPNFDPNKKYPTLLYCQGGPQSAVSQFWSYRWNFQLMAANGYIIVAPNRRGLPSFGREWNDQISGDWSGQAMKDYLSAIDAAAKEPFVDQDRLGAVGASYGGYSVYWLAGNHQKRFKCFIAHCGLFNLESWYGSTEELFFANKDIGGPYWDPKLKEAYLKHSPHRYVQNWDTPILVIHNGRDFRVPIGEGLQAFQAAQLRGIPSKFLHFPDEGHWVLKPQNGLVWHREFFSWLDKWLKTK